MATLIANADGNLTGSTTFAAAEAGALALVLNRNTFTTLAGSSTTTTVTFTVTSGKVIDGALLWMRNAQAGQAGTVKVDLQKGGVSQASVTVNKADIPDVVAGSTPAAPTFFKFTSTATGDGGSNWTIVLTLTGATQVSVFIASATVTNFTRALRTTTAATPAAADDLYVVGELTGAGTHNSRTVTMDSTATTAYGNGALNSTTVAGGGIHVANYGTFSYGTTGSINYVLRVNGDLIVYQFGTLNIGASGAEIPRTSTAVLEFQQVSVNGDFGLRILENATCNIAGLSRTSGKNVVQCKLTADAGTTTNNVSSFSTINGTRQASTVLETTGTSLLGNAFTDNATSGNHIYTFLAAGAVGGTTTQMAQVWLARGSGTNNRFVRLGIFTSTGMTLGYYADIDLQAGTIGAPTAASTATASSATITPVGNGFLCSVSGKTNGSATTNAICVAACSAAGTVSYVGNTTQCFVISNEATWNVTSAPSAVLSVDADTGWLANDVVAVASTSRTAAEAELLSLASDAGSSSFTANTPAGILHLGTAPRQAEVILLTRNVKIRSTSTTLMAYVYASALATINFSWAEFRNIGANVAGRHGIEFDGGNSTVNAKSVTYCSIHDCAFNGFYLNSNFVSLNVTFSNNVMWLNGTTSNFAVTVTAAVTNNDWTFDSNNIMRCTGGFSLSDVGGICTNNTVSSGTGSNPSFALLENNINSIGTFSGNTAHSCTYVGLHINNVLFYGTITNFTAWRNANNGIWHQTANMDVNYVGLTLFGNANQNFFCQTGGAVKITNTVINSDTSFSTATGIHFNATASVIFNFDNVDMSAGASGGGGAVHTSSDFNPNNGVYDLRITARNVKWGVLPPWNNDKTSWTRNSFIAQEKYQQTAGDHRTEMYYGQVRTDTAIYNTTSPSMRMVPVDAVYKLESAMLGRGILVPVANGSTVNIAVYVRKSSISDGAAYGGNQPRLIQRANPALGQNSDVVLASCTDSISPTPANLDASTALGVTVSGGNLVATNTSTATASPGTGAHGSVGRSSGKLYFEVTYTTITAPGLNHTIGVGLVGTTYSVMGNNAVGGAAINFVGGGINFNGNTTSGITLGSRAQGNVIGIALDLDNHQIWFRVAPSGNWNGSGTADPATNTGGIPMPTGMMLPYLTYGGLGGPNVGNVYTCNFGGSGFTGAVPSGFGSGWLTGTIGIGSWAQVSTTSSVATDAGAWEFVVDCDGVIGWINVDDWSTS